MLTVMEAGVQVVYVWLFTTIITACFRILDCTPDTNILILDPTLACPLGSAEGDPLPAVVAVVVFLLYVLPFIKGLIFLASKLNERFLLPLELT